MGGILFVSNCRLHGREEASVSLGCVGPGWEPLCALGSMSASLIVEMETSGMTAEAGGGEGSPSS